IEADAARRDRLQVTTVALGSRPDPRGVAEERDPPVTVRDEVPHGGPHTAAVVGSDAVRVADCADAVDEHERPAESPFAEHLALVAADRDDDEPVDTARHEFEQQLPLAR